VREITGSVVSTPADGIQIYTLAPVRLQGYIFRFNPVNVRAL
jgi:hypothetical protein